MKPDLKLMAAIMSAINIYLEEEAEYFRPPIQSISNQPQASRESVEHR